MKIDKEKVDFVLAECGLGFEYEENDIIEFNGEKFVECPCCNNWTELEEEEKC